MVDVGQCSNCGIVFGDSVSFNFPEPAECNECETKLETATVATEAELQAQGVAP